MKRYPRCRVESDARGFKIMNFDGRTIAVNYVVDFATDAEYQLRLAEARALVHAGNVLEAAVEAANRSER